MRAALVLPVGVLPLLACAGPMPVAQAEIACLDEAQLAARPRAEATIGAGSGGVRFAGLSVDLSADYLAGRDPERVWQSCVHRRSGHTPSRSYHSLPAEQGRVLPMRRG